MKTVKIPLQDATTAQLHQYATTVLGLSIAPSAARATILGKIAFASDVTDIVLPAAPQVQAAPASFSALSDDEGEMETIIIDKTEEGGGDQPVWVSVNGRGLWIERGKPQRVKKCYVHSLLNAVRTVYQQDRTDHDMVAREVPSYPFRILPRAA